jgi:hypothetical protein
LPPTHAQPTKLDDVHDDGPGEGAGHVDGRSPVHAGATDAGRAFHLAVVVGLGAYAWWTVGLAPFSAQATAAVVLAGVGAMAVGQRQRRSRRSTAHDDESGIAPWVGLAAVAGAWQLAAYLQHPRADHPTVSSLANELLDSHPARAAGFLVWIAAAWWLARRWSRSATLLGYALLVVSALGLEVAARRRGSATFVDALTIVLRSRAARFALLAAWLWLGWHLFVRVDWH